MAVATAAATLGIDKANIKFHEVFLGGAFGRRGPLGAIRTFFSVRCCFRRK